MSSLPGSDPWRSPAIGRRSDDIAPNDRGHPMHRDFNPPPRSEPQDC
ncbi:hypothetical protein [Prochlorothrix hollandica]